MAIFSRESLETLRQRIDLVEVLSPHIEFKRSGAAYKALCPFHDERSPSFMVQKGDSHYHCYGCGAHGDAIQFLMGHVKLSFREAVESLAERFHVPLELVGSEEEPTGPNKTVLKEALEHASRFFQFMLLHSAEGHEALKYLFKRGIDLDFINQFQVGWAPSTRGMLRQVLLSKGVKEDAMLSAGLLAHTQNGHERDFFLDRITFPIRDAGGAVIGFSARKYKEETFGGKYVNTQETALFKKSRVLFGLNYCRRRIAKERKAIVVEGQIDALRLIQAGFNITVAGQGTAFGEGHIKELLALGVNQVFLALDGDDAGHEASYKIGNLFQKAGVETRMVKLPPGMDPDAILRQRGSKEFLKLLETSQDYLSFLIHYRGRLLNMDSPAGKNTLLQELVAQVRSWEQQPVMVHESLRRLSKLTNTPEDVLGVGQEHIPNIYIRKSAVAGITQVDHDRIVESDLIAWLLGVGESLPQLVQTAFLNIKPEQLKVAPCRHLYQTYMERHQGGLRMDLLSLAIEIEDSEAQELMSQVLEKRVSKEHAEQHLLEVIQKILDRNWMMQREEVKMKIHGLSHSENEILELVKQFEELKRAPPKVVHALEKN